ncbi:UNVERIFIED_CONTAM: hypothetical protein HDU68_001267 [Siphonaria sp. JEL0065]|nr:hypothetical protein HDU68_001267 [Siphonaria sp. JEL0065]
MNKIANATEFPICETPPQINVISIEKLSQADPESLSNLRHSLTTLGFFYLDYTNVVPQSLIDGIRESATKSFECPTEAKQAVHNSKSKAFRGWSNLEEEVTNNKTDLKESYDFAFESSQQEPSREQPWRVMQGPNEYPDNGDNHLKSRVQEYLKSASKVSHILLKSIALILNREPQDLQKYFQDPYAYMRFIKYPASNGKKQGVGPHTDLGFLTLILQQENVASLQALSLSNEWVRIPPVPNTFVVNIGDVLQSWSGNVLRATPHRVINSENDKARISIAFFFEPSLDSVIEGPGLERGGVVVNSYGEHLLRTFLDSFPSYQYGKEVSSLMSH